jgi:hypothetical protein
MRRVGILLTCLAVLRAVSSSAQDKGRFDGAWSATLSCDKAASAMGYSFKFPATVKDGVLHAEKGAKGQAGWLQIDGKIATDGTAKLYADGLVGASEFAVGQRPAGTEYGYHIESKFTDHEGKGRRVEGRPCEIVFLRAQ